MPPYLDDVDVTSNQEVKKFVEDTVRKYGRLDGVFNCAGVNPTSIPLEETTDEYWDKLVNTNLKGVFAGGDCVNGGKEVVDAVQAGKDGARAILNLIIER